MHAIYEMTQLPATVIAQILHAMIANACQCFEYKARMERHSLITLSGKRCTSHKPPRQR